MRPTREELRALVALVVLFVVAACAVPLLSGALFAQAVESAASGAAPEANSANEWGGALVWAFFSSSALEWLKRNRYITIITEQSTFILQRGIGVLLAVAAAVGVHWTFDPTAGRLVVDGLTAAGLWTVGSETVRQWVLQELTYRTAVRPYRPVDQPVIP